jgi:hypothetical protein
MLTADPEWFEPRVDCSAASQELRPPWLQSIGQDVRPTAMPRQRRLRPTLPPAPLSGTGMASRQSENPIANPILEGSRGFKDHDFRSRRPKTSKFERHFHGL